MFLNTQHIPGVYVALDKVPVHEGFYLYVDHFLQIFERKNSLKSIQVRPGKTFNWIGVLKLYCKDFK